MKILNEYIDVSLTSVGQLCLHLSATEGADTKSSNHKFAFTLSSWKSLSFYRIANLSSFGVIWNELKFHWTTLQPGICVCTNCKRQRFLFGFCNNYQRSQCFFSFSESGAPTSFTWLIANHKFLNKICHFSRAHLNLLIVLATRSRLIISNIRICIHRTLALTHTTYSQSSNSSHDSNNHDIARSCHGFTSQVRVPGLRQADIAGDGGTKHEAHAVLKIHHSHFGFHLKCVSFATIGI